MREFTVLRWLDAQDGDPSIDLLYNDQGESGFADLSAAVKVARSELQRMGASEALNSVEPRVIVVSVDWPTDAMNKATVHDPVKGWVTRGP